MKQATSSFRFWLSFLTLLAGLFSSSTSWAQPGEYDDYFAEAYQRYSSVPKGLLEAVAYTNTRMRHLNPVASCQEVPTYYGVMGLIEDGKGYFNNSLLKVAQLSGYTIEAIKQDPRTNILAYAAAYARLQQNKRMANQRVETHQPIIEDLSEIPVDGDIQTRYALDQQFYGVLREMQEPHSRVRSRRVFDFEQIFGPDNYRVLSADRVTVEKYQVRSTDGSDFDPGNREGCTASGQRPDYSGALFVPANRRNYGSRNGANIEFITIHTVQGSYASAIAWFKNRNARVSAHYIIRASDGQITQMVCEEDRAFHVRDHNDEAIGIEHEGFIGDGTAWYTNEMYESSAALVRDICERHDIDPRRTFAGPPTDGVRPLSDICRKIKGHQHFSGNTHIDPGPLWDWDRYYRLINPATEPKVFTERNGEIVDSGGKEDGHGSFEQQTYLIQPENAGEITLLFETLDLENNGDKPLDYLDIYDGDSRSGRYLGRFSGKTPPDDPLIARSGAVFIEFRSDCQVNKPGYVLRYRSGPGDRDCPLPTDLVASDLFPMGANLSWEASSPATQYLVYLRRRNFEDKWTLFRTTENTLVATGLAANAIYDWQVRAVCGADTSAVAGESFNTPNTVRDGRVQVYTVQVNEGRFFDSGGQQGGYGNEENFLYRIIPPDGGRVELRFASFETEPDLDRLIVYDGLNPTGSPRLGTFSGSKGPQGSLVSSGNGMALLFTSDSRTNAAGWQAYWRSVAGNGPDPTPVDPDSVSDPNTDDSPTPATPPVAVDFTPDLSYPSTAPETEPQLKDRYNGSFALTFNDEDNSGRGLANRFYSLAQQDAAGFRANPGAGFFFDDFENGLRSFWTQAAGNWRVENGLLTQTNVTLSNTNLYADLTQTGDEVYLYHWKARMTGASDNRRHGLHFFASDPQKSDRGTSYFVWIRQSDRGSSLEIYKTVNDQFDRKVVKPIDLQAGEVYDYKTIYNPRKGRIEVYVNNEFGASWVDPYPLQAGRALSLRSGNCEVTFDDLVVYQSRGRSVSVQVGEGGSAPLTGTGRFLVHSLIVDRRINWSPVSRGYAQVGDEAPPAPEPSDPVPAPTTGLANSYSGPFELQLAGRGETFFLPSDYQDRRWDANRQLGFLHEAFPGDRLSVLWQPEAGDWRVRDGRLQQVDATVGNSNLFIPLEQNDDQAYLYHFRARMRSDGDNRRLGLHFFCSEGKDNRGDSYLAWFRFNGAAPGRVEVYRSDNNELPAYLESRDVPLEADRWYDIKVSYDPRSGQIAIFLDDALILSWQDPQRPHQQGGYLSLRTGNAVVEFDDLRVYQQATQNPLRITVGRQQMLRYRDQAKFYFIGRNDQGWSPVREQRTRIE